MSRAARPWAWLSALVIAGMVAAGALAPAARADGDPGSDVLVYEPLFLAADAGVSVAQQVRLGDVLRSAARAGFPIRVAIIATSSDLGAVTELWNQPQTYARFLSLELSLAYRGRLLVVMPHGLGFAWPGHRTAAGYRALRHVAIGRGGAGLAGAAVAAVRTLAAAGRVKLAEPPAGGSVSARPGAGAGAGAGAARPEGSAPGTSADLTATLIAVAFALAVAATLLGRRLLGPLGRRPRPRGRVRAFVSRRPLLLLAVSGAGTLATAAALVVVIAAAPPGGSAGDQQLARNPSLDPGTPLSGPAPGFSLTDQFGQPVSLSAFRGKVVLLAFNDSECTTVCPLTTTAMLDARAMLGPAGARVQLLGVDANPKATALSDVLAYSQLHRMLRAWHFLTGSLAQLKRVWRAYKVSAAIEAGEIAHTPALYVIDPAGRLARVYLTQQSYSSVAQFGQLLATEASRLLPDHPRVRSRLSYASVPGISPAQRVALPRSGGGMVGLGPGHARLYLFFATWTQEVTSLAGHLEALDRYAGSAGSRGLPALTAVDEGSVEPSVAALPDFLAGLRRPLAYPVALDRDGRVADGYGVQGQPWFVLTTSAGRTVWYWSVATSGWPSPHALTASIRAALSRAPQAPAGLPAVQRRLSGSPAPLGALHAQAGRVLGSTGALAARVRSLRGYPVVINAWASWCTPCRAEFGLFASASARYGRRVGFLGADTGDSAGDARAFLIQHPVSYPSYRTTTSAITSIAPGGLQGLPTTLFLSRTGKLEYVHIGQYQSQGTLDADIETYALGS